MTAPSNPPETTSTIDEAGYSQSRLIRAAVERAFIIIGEALKLMAQRDPQLPSKRICRF